MRLYARIDTNSWSPVISVDDLACIVEGSHYTFDEIWAETPPAAEAAQASSTRRWPELPCPLPYVDLPCWAYAMSYPSHRREVRVHETFRFPKHGPARVMSDAIPFRSHLDYEAEIGLLMHRDTPHRFGYFMVNDLTDRSIQVREHSSDQLRRAESFTRAKSFEGALIVGPLLAIGDEADWTAIELQLRVNDVLKQTVRATDCILTPAAIHNELFAAESTHQWLMAATGTAEGVLLTVPSLARKMELVLRSGFSMKAARELHLKHHVFLQPGDVLEMRSPQLGYNRAVITEAAQIDIQTPTHDRLA